MPNLPIRGLGSIGVVSDANPYDLPVAAWSNARNLRFDPEGVSRSSVFKPFILKQTFISPPVYVVDDSLKASIKAISTLRKNGTMTRIVEGAVSEVGPITPITPLTLNPTGTIAGQVSYINTGTDRPVSIADGEARYAYIPNWDEADRCRSFRSYRDFLIALYVTKGTTEYPNMVKWSDAVTAGVRPKWNVAAENGLAGENVLNGSSGYLVDGLELGNSFLIYGTREVFRMDYIGAPLVFSFEKLFNDFSVMTQNCIVEVNSKHYVFCEDDIVVTDGISRQSICESKVRREIFSRMDFSKRDRCRAIHNSLKSEILFCYPSQSNQAAWPLDDETGCNEAAIFNYASGTWSFIDLPNVTYGDETAQPQGTIASSQTWAGLASWNDIKEPWSFVAASPMTLILASAGQAGTTADVYFYDDDVGGRIANPNVAKLVWPAWCETKLSDFDEVGFSLSSTKLARQIIPQVITGDPSHSVTFYIMGETLNTDDSNWTDPMQFNPFSNFKLNTRANGRYLSIRFEVPAGVHARFSGYDLDLVQIAGR